MIRATLYQVGKKWFVGALNKSDILAAEAKEVLAKTAKVTKPKISFGQKATQTGEGLQILAEQNRSTFNFGKKQSRNYISHLIGETPNISLARREFYNATGLQLHCPTKSDLGAFTGGLENLENAIKGTGMINAMTPQPAVKIDLKGIKHVLIGHGVGSVDKNSWAFYETRQKVLDYINKNIPKGEQVLVMTCETGTQNAQKLGIGSEVSTLLTDFRNPGKVVEAGRNEIIGQVVLPPFGNGITFY
ncbi:hypothetical protein J6E39_02150 [bacterium]|nr:hypothetical protein [bacterium]